MPNHGQKQPAAFGGAWTTEKLKILESYLDTYTTALKDQPFKLIYIDAFAGRGQIRLPADSDSSDFNNFVSGSVERALRVDSKPFDKLVFVEKDPDSCAQLESLRRANVGRNIVIENSEANHYLATLDEDWKRWRGVLFLDPFATQVKWSTIERIASFDALDTWILFPVSAIARMLPRLWRPEEAWEGRLTRVYGGDCWRRLYSERKQQNLFGELEYERDPGVEGLLDIYRRKLSNLFGARFLQQSRTLKNSRNSALFEFLFCVGHPGGINLAKRIATHILERI